MRQLCNTCFGIQSVRLSAVTASRVLRPTGAVAGNSVSRLGEVIVCLEKAALGFASRSTKCRTSVLSLKGRGKFF